MIIIIILYTLHCINFETDAWKSLSQSSEVERVVNTYINAMELLITRKDLFDTCYETGIIIT